jgi:hypothetical protein
MNKILNIVLFVVLLGGCREATTNTADNYRNFPKGQFKVAQEDLPKQVSKFAQMIEQLPRVSSDDEFRSILMMYGLNKEPDFYKDAGNFWFLDEEFRSETDKPKLYRIAIGHSFTHKNPKIAFFFASIDREFSSRPRETLWEIEWPVEPAN